MVTTDLAMTEQSRTQLRSLVDKRLQFVEGAYATFDSVWKVIRLHFEDMSLDVIAKLTPVIVDEWGNEDEFSSLVVVRSPDTELENPGISSRVTRVQVNDVVRDVRICSDSLVTLGAGKPVSLVTYDQALIVECANSHVILDKRQWYSEMIALRVTPSDDFTIYDEDNLVAPAEDDLDTSYIYSTRVESVVS